MDDLEATSGTKDHVLCWYSNVVELQVAVTVRCIIVSEDGQHAFNSDAGSGGWNEDDGLLEVWVLILGVGLAHDDVDLAAWVAGAAGPPFLMRY